MASLIDKWRNWRDLCARKNAVTEALSSRNPGTVKTALANIKPEEIKPEEKTGYMRRAIDEQSLECFKQVLIFADDPNMQIEVNEGSDRYPDRHNYSLLTYALKCARTHDISLTLAGDPRVIVRDDDLELAKAGGMQDVAAVLAGRVADMRRHEADLRLQEAAHLDQEAHAPVPATEAPAPSEAPAPAATTEGETWALMSETSVAHVTASPLIGRKLTAIFNFADKERVIITENLKTGAETIGAAEKFDSLSPDTIQRAADRLKALSSEGQKRTFSL